MLEERAPWAFFSTWGEIYTLHVGKDNNNNDLIGTHTWKVMEFKNFISRPGKSWNLIVGPRKSRKIKALFEARTM